jgi:hypothetical protein
VPQEPQLALSVDVLVQVPAQRFGVAPAQLHELDWQVLPPVQVTPHPPQSELFDVSSTHELPQSLRPEAWH